MSADADRYPCLNPRNYHEGVAPATRHASRQFMPFRMFQVAAAMVPAKTALVTEDGSLTFAELDELTRRMASGLMALGVQRGEAVSVLMGNRWEQFALWLAVARMGAVFMAASRYMTRTEILFQLDELRPRLVIGDYGVKLDDILAAATGDPVEPFNNELAGFAIRFSSGTTGRPKMMIASHRTQSWIYPMYASEQGLSDSDVHFCVGPLAHAALHYAMAALFVGATVVMKEKFDKETLWNDCARHKITNTMLVPTMITSALDYPGEAPELRTVTSVGAPLTPALKTKFLHRFPRIGLFDMYGASEFGTVTCLRPHEQMLRPTSAGRACVGSEIQIFDDEGKPVPVGEIGSIYCRGPSIVDGVIGSVKPPALPAHLVADGWWSCGDLGKLDADGYLYFSDRRVDLILSGGLNVYPAEVEAALVEVPGIRNAVVVGLPDEKWGQRVTAYVEGQAAQEDLQAVLKEKLAPYKHPRAVHYVPELPRTSTGKLSRKLVRDAIAAGQMPS